MPEGDSERVAAGFVGKREEVISLLQVQEGPRSNQVLLKVRFAEVKKPWYHIWPSFSKAEPPTLASQSEPAPKPVVEKKPWYKFW